ncbi:MAG TPA: c-type cytochrome [Flavisolibacter sp.]|nr:c-type cytochrome [Flavisolibacter sp.]
MRKAPLVIACAIAAGSALFIACSSEAKTEEKAPVAGHSDLVSRGEYLVATIGCDDCHSPKRMGAKGPEVIPELRLSGYPADRPVQVVDTAAMKKGWMLMGPDLTVAAGPWGVSFAANITSDGTGIGNWNESNFITAMRHGKAKGIESGRPLLPPMPWFNFAKMTDEDLKSILAYLKTTTPVKNVVPAPLPPANM